MAQHPKQLTGRPQRWSVVWLCPCGCGNGFISWVYALTPEAARDKVRVRQDLRDAQVIQVFGGWHFGELD